MGWRVGDHYDDAMEEDYQRWRGSLTPGERRRIRAGQALRIALLLAPVMALIFGILRAFPD